MKFIDKHYGLIMFMSIVIGISLIPIYDANANRKPIESVSQTAEIQDIKSLELYGPHAYEVRIVNGNGRPTDVLYDQNLMDKLCPPVKIGYKLRVKIVADRETLWFFQPDSCPEPIK